MRWYFVAPAQNDGSAFANHLALVWTAAGHTYAYGFHVISTLAQARALDLELVRHLTVVWPRGTPAAQTPSVRPNEHVERAAP